MSARRYSSEIPPVGVRRSAAAWDALPTDMRAASASVEVTELSDGERVSKASFVRTSRVIDFLEELEAGALPSRRVSKRYHAGVGSKIDRTLPAIQSFVPSDDLRALARQLRLSVE
jgi:hypothetical protein